MELSAVKQPQRSTWSAGAYAAVGSRRGLLWRFPVSEDDTLVLQLDYLEVVVRKPVWL